MPTSLHKLRSLLEVVDRGGFSGAATSLGIAQSALSRHIKELEALFGQRLLHRTGRGTVPTAFAEQFLPRVRDLVRDAEQLTQDILAANGDVVGRVRIGIAQSLSAHLITPLLRETAILHPKLEVYVREGLSDHIDEALIAGHADLGILYLRHTDHPRVDDEVLMTVDFVLAGAVHDPHVAHPERTLAEVSALPLIMAALPNRWRSWVEHVFTTSGHRLRVAREIDSLQTIKDLVRLPGHYSILSPHLIEREIEAGLVAASQIVDPPIRRKVVLRYSAQKSTSQGCKAIGEILRRQVRDQVRAGRLANASCDERS